MFLDASPLRSSPPRSLSRCGQGDSHRSDQGVPATALLLPPTVSVSPPPPARHTSAGGVPRRSRPAAPRGPRPLAVAVPGHGAAPSAPADGRRCACPQRCLLPLLHVLHVCTCATGTLAAGTGGLRFSSSCPPTSASHRGRPGSSSPLL